MKHNKRISAILSVCLLVCIMATMLVVPVSAATFETTVGIGYIHTQVVAAWIYEHAAADLQGFNSYAELAESLGIAAGNAMQSPAAPDGSAVYLPEANFATIVEKYNTAYPETSIGTISLTKYYNPSGEVFYKIPAPGAVGRIVTLNYGKFTYSTTGRVVDSVGDNALSGVLSQIVDILPVVLVVLVGFIGLRKGVSFVRGILHSA